MLLLIDQYEAVDNLLKFREHSVFEVTVCLKVNDESSRSKAKENLSMKDDPSGAASPIFVNDQDACAIGGFLKCGCQEPILFKGALFASFRFSPFLQSPKISWLKVDTHYRYDAIHNMIRTGIDGIQTEVICVGAL